MYTNRTEYYLAYMDELSQALRDLGVIIEPRNLINSAGTEYANKNTIPVLVNICTQLENQLDYYSKLCDTKTRSETL